MRKDCKIRRVVYTGAGIKSIEWIDPPGPKKAAARKPEKTEVKKDK